MKLLDRMEEESKREVELEKQAVQAWRDADSSGGSSSAGSSSGEEIGGSRRNDRGEEDQKGDYSSGLSDDNDMDLLQEDERKELDKLKNEFTQTMSEE